MTHDKRENLARALARHSITYDGIHATLDEIRAVLDGAGWLASQLYGERKGATLNEVEKTALVHRAQDLITTAYVDVTWDDDNTQ